MRLIVPVLGLALAACTARPGDGSSAPTMSPTASAAQRPAASSLDGRYLVVSIDGAAPIIDIAGHDPIVTIEGDRVHFQSQCIYADWTLARAGGKLAAKPHYEPGSAMCARGLAPGETAIQDAFTGLTAIAPVAGGLVVEGAGRRLALRRTANPEPAPPAPPAAVASLAGEWRVAAIDGRDFNESYGLALSGSARELWWEPRCAGVARRYRIEGARIAFTAPPGAALAGKPAEVCAIGLPDRLPDVVRALDAATTVQRTEANGLLIGGGGRSVLLFSQ